MTKLMPTLAITPMGFNLFHHVPLLTSTTCGADFYLFEYVTQYKIAFKRGGNA